MEGLVVPVDELGVAEDPAEPAAGAREQSTTDAEAVSVGGGALFDEGRPQAWLGDGALVADHDGAGKLAPTAKPQVGVGAGTGSTVPPARIGAATLYPAAPGGCYSELGCGQPESSFLECSETAWQGGLVLCWGTRKLWRPPLAVGRGNR